MYKRQTLGRGFAWLDTGNHDALLDAADFVAAVQKRQGMYISCIEEIEFRRGFIDKQQLLKLCLLYTSSNNYGPYQFPEKLIPLIINNALHGKKLPVYGDGKNVRDWLYVEDHAKAIDMVQEQGRLFETYNVGGHNEKMCIRDRMRIM